MKNKKIITYISLFSGAGIGCYGFKQEGFECVATVEVLQKRLTIQRFNNKCRYDSAYISDDITTNVAKDKIMAELLRWNIKEKGDELDVIVATPPCQGISVANHKKRNELRRNSLITESISLIMKINPKFFIFENVRGFLNALCTDFDSENKKIKEVIEINLAGRYHISYNVVNFKDYGCPSSRTRTLVVGTRKDLTGMTPMDILPNPSKEKYLKEIIGHLPPLHEMGEICETDIFHSFKKYNPLMRDWIVGIKEGETAFDNKDHNKIPHKIIDGSIVYNVNKNGDKYKRQCWDKVAPCIHTRNDILSSQNTVHPKDDRVFSIRELMIMMSIPDSFKWTDMTTNELNKLTLKQKMEFLAKEEMNIRHCIGEAVPTVIFKQLANKIKNYLLKDKIDEKVIKKIIKQYKLDTIDNLKNYIKENADKQNYSILSKISELSNTARNETAAYYTRQDICYSIIKDLPDANNFKVLRILEPSVGVGNFLPLLIEKYKSVDSVVIDVVDVDENAIEILKLLLKSISIPSNVTINLLNVDFLLHDFKFRYNIVIGNPPFKKLNNDKALLAKYKKGAYNVDTNNLVSFFIEKSFNLGDVVSLITPKSLVNAPEFNKTRELFENKKIKKIIDYGEIGFKGVKIETISFIAFTQGKPKNNKVEIESYIFNNIKIQNQDYIFSKEFPYWLIYRNKFFDYIADKMQFGVFKAYRDRQITKKITKSSGKIRVLKSRNISSIKTINIKDYDSYIDEVNSLDVSKFLNNTSAVLVPNLTYLPRACFLPENTITDGSVAILTPKSEELSLNERDLEYFGTEEYEKFYRIARNFSTRSMNIDNNSVFFFGVLRHETINKGSSFGI